MSRRVYRALPTCLLLLGLALAPGCGYQSLLATPSPDGAQAATPPIRVAVRALRSESAEPWLDRVVGEALRRELDLRGRFRLVDDPKHADLVVAGRIRPLAVGGNSFSSFVVAVEYRVTLSLELEVMRRGGDVVRLAPQGLSETDVFLASGDIEITRTNRLEALRHLSDVIAVRVADSLEWIAHPEKPS